MPGDIVIGWDETVPAGSESVGLGDDRIRSTKSNVRGALDAEHNFPSSGGSAGAHRLGSARAHFGTQSRVSSGDTDGRLMVASDTSRLFGVGSGGTALLGAGPLSLSLGSHVGVTMPQRSHVVMETGRAANDGSGNLAVTFPSPYSGIPVVFLGMEPVGPSLAYISQVTSIATSGFSARMFDSAGAAIGTGNIIYLSIGTRAL